MFLKRKLGTTFPPGSTQQMQSSAMTLSDLATQGSAGPETVTDVGIRTWTQPTSYSPGPGELLELF